MGSQAPVMTFCFDTTRGQEEGQEFEKILYFYPPTTPPNTQKVWCVAHVCGKPGHSCREAMDSYTGHVPLTRLRQQQAVVGLTEGLNGFTSLFGRPGTLRSMHSTGKRQIVIEGEKGIWLGVARTPATSAPDAAVTSAAHLCLAAARAQRRGFSSLRVCSLPPQVASTSAIKPSSVSDDAIRALLREFYDLAFTLHGAPSPRALAARPHRSLVAEGNRHPGLTDPCHHPLAPLRRTGRIRDVLEADPSGNLARRAHASSRSRTSPARRAPTSLPEIGRAHV